MTGAPADCLRAGFANTLQQRRDVRVAHGVEGDAGEAITVAVLAEGLPEIGGPVRRRAAVTAEVRRYP